MQSNLNSTSCIEKLPLELQIYIIDLKTHSIAEAFLKNAQFQLKASMELKLGIAIECHDLNFIMKILKLPVIDKSGSVRSA